MKKGCGSILLVNRSPFTVKSRQKAFCLPSWQSCSEHQHCGACKCQHAHKGCAVFLFRFDLAIYRSSPRRIPSFVTQAGEVYCWHRRKHSSEWARKIPPFHQISQCCRMTEKASVDASFQISTTKGNDTNIVSGYFFCSILCTSESVGFLFPAKAILKGKGEQRCAF